MLTKDIYIKITQYRNRFIPPGKRILSIGINEGQFDIKRIFKDCWFSTIDTNHDADFIVKDIADVWPDMPNDFDVVIATTVLNENPYFWKILFNITDVCNKGGCIIIAAAASSKKSLPESKYSYLFDRNIGEAWGKYISCELVDFYYDEKSGLVSGVYKKI